MKLVVDNTKKKKEPKPFVKIHHIKTVKVGRISWRFNTKKQEYIRRGNIFFYLNEVRAVSCNWFTYVLKIGPYVVLNTHEHVPESGQHIEHMVALLDHLGIKVDHEIDAPAGLDELLTIKNYYEEKGDKEKLKLMNELLRYRK